MDTNDFKNLLNSIEETGFDLLINTKDGLVKVESFKLNFKDGYLVLNTITT